MEEQEDRRITVELTGEANEAVLAQLERHGCTVNRKRRYVYRITFPEGTERRFYLRISHTDRFHLVLPDGLVVTELVTTRLYPPAKFSALYVPAEESQSVATHLLTFRDLYIKHEIHLAQLAKDADVSPRITYFLLEGQPVQREQAARVLAVLSARTGMKYTLDTVHIELLNNEIGDDDHAEP